MRADAQRNYERLLAAARAAFTEHGADASTDEIAKRAGVGPGTLYRHFPTREALIEGVLRDEAESMVARGWELLEADSAEDGLVRWLRAVREHSTNYRGLAAVLMKTVLADDSGTPSWKAECHERVTTVGTALVRRAQETGAIRPDVDVGVVLRMVNGVALATDHLPGGPDEADRLLDLVVDGLRYQPA